MATELSPILVTAKEILHSAGLKGMQVKDIAATAAAQNKNMGLTAEEFQKKLQAALTRNVKSKSAKPAFMPVNWEKGPRKGKPRQGWFRLKQQKIVPAIAAMEAPPVSTAFCGKAGEYAVMSELLFWGYNASLMAVDDGIDIIASKDNKFFHIQAKTASRQVSGKYTFSVSLSSFKRYDAANTFYIFVLRDNFKNEFIAIPSINLGYFISSGVIANVATLSLSIAVDHKKSEYVLNGKANVTPFFGKLAEIIR